MKYLLSALILWSATALSLHAKTEFLHSRVKSADVKQSKGTPHEINYQGWLGDISDTTGVTGTFNMMFRFYDAPTGGTVLWNEAQNNIPVDKGIFNVILGSATPLPVGIFTGATLWLETQVETDTLVPRKKLVSVGYAIKSETADNAVYADTTDYATTAGSALSANYADSAGVTGYSWNGYHAVYADTADYALSANVQYVDSAGVSANAWKWNNNLWGVKYPEANIADTATIAITADTANYVAGADVDGEVAQANYADTAGYAPPDDDWTRSASGNHVFTLNTTDSVGIGTTSPGAKLDVAGRIWQTGTGKSVFLGEGAGANDDLSDNRNVFVGYEAGYSNTAGRSNTFSGYMAGRSNSTGNQNTFSGYKAGILNSTGSGNVFLGDNAGYFENGSNKLYIDNSDTPDPLIYGDFSADSVCIHGNFHVTGTVSANVKAFVIEHPTKSGHKLVHSCLEGPEVGVYYRGEAELVDGEAVVKLPEYFESLTRKDGRTVQLTPKGTEPFILSYTDIINGEFRVYGRKLDGSKSASVFSWEVKAVRRDVDPLAVEVSAK